MTALRWAQRFTLTAPLRLDSAMTIGGDATGTIDIPVVVDGLGRPIVPGTTLAGVLRTAVEPSLTDAQARFWFGGIGDADRASRVSVEDALLEGALLEIRDGVGIDRDSGTAAPAVKYNRQVVAAGATFTVEVTVETDDAEQEPEVVGLLVAAFTEGIQLGGATSRGSGMAHLLAEGKVTATHQRFTTFDDTLAALEGGEEVTVQPRDLGRHRLRLELPWRPVSSLMVRSGVDGNAVDDLPLTSGQGRDEVVILLPGSTVKGALRTRAEWIVRTVLGRSTPSAGPDHGDRFNEQIDIPLVRELFGSPAAVGADGTTALPQGRGALSVSDVRSLDDAGAVRAVPAESWQRIAAARRRAPTEDGAPYEDLVAAIAAAGFTPDELIPRPHVAIDRWTGATANSALFGTLEVRLSAWEPIRLDLDLNRLERRLPELRDRQAAILLLLLTVRDLADGQVPLGFGVNRGHGSVRAQFDHCQMTAKGSDAVEFLGVADPLDPGGLAELEDSWQSWISDNRSDDRGVDG